MFLPRPRGHFALYSRFVALFSLLRTMQPVVLALVHCVCHCVFLRVMPRMLDYITGKRWRQTTGGLVRLGGYVRGAEYTEKSSYAATFCAIREIRQTGMNCCVEFHYPTGRERTTRHEREICFHLLKAEGL